MFNRVNRRWLRTTLALFVVLVCAAPAAASHRAGSRPDGWKIYRNERYAFCVSYPADSRVQTHRDRHYQYSRIQNYDAAVQPQGELAPGEYYVEVFIFDHRLGHRMEGRCAELLREAHTVKWARSRAGAARPSMRTMPAARPRRFASRARRSTCWSRRPRQTRSARSPIVSSTPFASASDSGRRSPGGSRRSRSQPALPMS